MKLTILGSGTCVPSSDRASSGYWIDAGDVRMRLDCGSGSVHAMARYGVAWESITHQFVSHFHVDHVGELPALLFALKHGRSAPRAEPLTLVGPEGLRPLVEGLANQLGAGILAQDFPIFFQELRPGDLVELAYGVHLRVAKTDHTAESLAVRIDADRRSIGYSGDAAPTPELRSLFAGVDVLVCECSFLDDRRGTKHMLADDVSRLAADAGVRHLVATHCYFDPDAVRLAERLARGFDGEITIARDGLALDLGRRDGSQTCS